MLLSNIKRNKHQSYLIKRKLLMYRTQYTSQVNIFFGNVPIINKKLDSKILHKLYLQAP